MKKFISLLTNLTIGLLAFVGCGSSDSGSSTSASKAIVPYCADVQSHSTTVNLSGQAQFEYRQNGNGTVASPSPIRYAEVTVLNAANAVVQCGTTDATGVFNLEVPADIGTVTITVSSRSANAQANAYVLDDPTNNQAHILSVTANTSQNQNVGTLTASATGSLLGGAFNILDQIQKANAYLQSETSGCSSTYPTCQEITTPPLVTVFWKPGFNPGTYFGVESGLSYYLPDVRQLYILGGIDGDVDNSDTDHFDNSIVLHEYGHFLEDVYSITNSPGGPHSGNAMIDPRLAWGEGWANFFQAAVTGLPIYRDTFGTADGTPGVHFSENIETPDNDIALQAGGGNFREFSISRLLWDSIDTANEGTGVDDLSGTFGEFWAGFTSNPSGIADPNLTFRSIGLYHMLQQNLPSSSDWSTIRSGEMHEGSLKDYANTLSLGGSCPSTVIQAASIPGAMPENGDFANTNRLASNDYYAFTHPGGAFTMNLSYTTTGSNPADLEIFIWNEDHNYGVESDVAAVSGSTISVGESSGSENISTSLSAGNYLINIHVYTKERLGSAANYDMTINGQTACPD